MPCGHPHVDANNVERLVEKGFRWLMPAPTPILRRARQGAPGERTEIARAASVPGRQHMTTARPWVYAAARSSASSRRYARSISCSSPRARGRRRRPRENFAAEHEIGRRFRIDPASLPPPDLQRSASNGPQTVPYAGQRLNVPPGFTATPFATGDPEPAPSAGPAERRRAGGAAERQARCCCCATTAAGRRLAASAMPAASMGLTGWRGAATNCSSPTRTASGACRPGARPEPVTRQRRVRGRSRPQQPADRDRPAKRRAVRRGRLDGQYRGRAGAEGDDPAFRPGRVEPDELRRRHPQPDDAGRSTRRPANCGPGCRSATGSATICRPTT